MALGAEAVVVYDTHERISPRHIMKRNGPHVAACGNSLQPWGQYRTLDGLDTDRDSPEADCRPCLFARAAEIVRQFQGVVPPEIAAAVNRQDDLDDKVEVLLAEVLRVSSWSAETLIREHFPRTIVERAEVRAESRES